VLHSPRFGYRRDEEQQICFGLNIRRDHSFTNEKRKSSAIRNQAIRNQMTRLSAVTIQSRSAGRPSMLERITAHPWIAGYPHGR
jgi:hypothetical protein